MNQLKALSSPQDLQDLSLSELKSLVKEIRERIIEVLSTSGGHLSSNLGIVELMVALHATFDSPHDKFIFDVSHQSYVHKLLTGRNDRFETIRSFKGLCGFSHPKESEHDHFYAGHAGTALSLALGVAKNRDLTKRHEHVIPIIGDASLTCGLTLEALNNVPKDLKKFIVILNDNEMSISKNVGNIKNIMSRLINHPFSNKVYHELQAVLSKVPGYGDFLAKQGQKLTESVKHLVSPAAFFEQFGLTYVGPIDGHDLPKLLHTLKSLKDATRPILLHVLTVKGKGMPIATENPTSYHGVKPFDITSGKFLSSGPSKPTFPKLFGKKIYKMGANDPSLVVVTPAMPAGSCLTSFMQEFPERCLDVGIAEGHSVTFAGGLAYGKKMKIVAVIYATFLQRALDNLFHDVCLQELPVVFALDRAFISGPDGSTHHGIYDIGFLKAMPNMIIAQPRDGKVLEELMNAAFDWEKPVAIRYPNLSTQESSSTEKRELGKGELLKEGKDLLLISLGHMADTAFEVAEILSKEGINPTIVDPVFVKPLDQELFLTLITNHKMIVTIEEHSVTNGLGSIINSFILSNGFTNKRVYNSGIPETFVQHGERNKLLKEIGLDANSIAKKCLQLFEYEREEVLS